MTGFTAPATPPHRVIRFRGVTSNGVHVNGGTRVTDLTAWMHGQYRRGYRWLVVTDADGVTILGEITTNRDGTRDWWSEG